MSLRIRLIDLVRNTDILERYKDLIELSSNDTLFNEKRNDHLVRLLLSLKDNSFYEQKLESFTPEYIKWHPYEVLKSLPIIDKETINKNYTSLYTPIKGRETQLKKTGGSTGNPLYYYVDKEHLSWFWAHIYFFWHLYAGYKPGDPFITIAGNSLRTVKRKAIEDIYHKLQNNYFIKGDLIKPTLKLNKQKLNTAVLLYGYPSSISSILKIIPDLTYHTKSLKAVFTTSEQLTLQTRQIIEEAFKVPVYDMYGANDGGILTCECGEHKGYHINSINCFVESFMNEFEMSELLLTNINSYSFPFVRYRVGDLGTLDYTPCSCGLKWPRVIELKGRTRDIIHLPDGNQLHGSFFNSLFYKYPIIDGYKIIQEEDYSIVLHIHVKDDLYNDQLFIDISNSLKSEITSNINNIEIRIVRMHEFNVSSSKFKLVESHVNQSL